MWHFSPLIPQIRHFYSKLIPDFISQHLYWYLLRKQIFIESSDLNPAKKSSQILR